MASISLRCVSATDSSRQLRMCPYDNDGLMPLPLARLSEEDLRMTVEELRLEHSRTISRIDHAFPELRDDLTVRQILESALAPSIMAMPIALAPVAHDMGRAIALIDRIEQLEMGR